MKTRTAHFLVYLQAYASGCWLSFKDTFRLVFLGADTVTIRLLLAWSSLWSALALFIDDDKFQLPAYAVVKLLGTEQMWGCYFLLHFIGIHWRIFNRARSRPKWALVINTYGFFLWFYSTIGLCMAVGSVGIVSALALTLCAASAWALYRTGLGKDVVTP